MIDVTCAIIMHEGKILVTQRGPDMKLPGKWEFPGGKVEAGESPEHCIQREILEELNLIIRPVERLKDYFFDYNDFQITLIPFIADLVSGEIHLTEHRQYLWLKPAELASLDWAAADQGIFKDLIIRFVD